MMLPFVFCVAILPFGFGEKIHERMTDQEVEQIFQTTPDAVPDYELVQFHVSKLVKRGTRSARALRFKAFGGNLTLWVHPVKGVLASEETPVYIAKRKPDGKIVYKVYSKAMRKVGQLMEDPEMKASVIIHTDSKGRRSIDGHVASKNLVIRSLPDSILNDLSNNHSLGNLSSTESSNSNLDYHVVFKNNVTISSIVNGSTQFSENATVTKVTKSRQKIPKVLYPEIMVVVDSTLLKLNGNNIDRLLRYVVIFWNDVDLLYRTFERPKFRFNIARVIVAKEQNAVPYISENMNNLTNIYANDALQDAQLFYFELLDKFSTESYDAVVTMSRLVMEDRLNCSNVFDSMAEHGGACRVDFNTKKVEKVAIIRDTGIFDGVFNAAHAIANLLGSNNDDRDVCRPQNGWIMSQKSQFTALSHDFSHCTRRDIQKWLSQREGTCLYNKPNTTNTNPLPRTLPGQLISRDYQCKMLNMGKSCYNEATHFHMSCTAVYCKDPKNADECLKSTGAIPVDGAFCSSGKVCLHEECVKIKDRRTNHGK